MQRAAELLRGRVAVLIGGQDRPAARARLERELGLRAVHWLETRPHRPIAPLAERIAAPDVDLVLVIIRLADHAFSDLARVAAEHGKVFVRLPRGYGVSAVAHEVLRQASQALGDPLRSRA